VFSILTYPDLRLKELSSEVAEFGSALTSLANELEETMRAGPGGVGIAAPQVGEHIRMIIVDAPERSESSCHGKLILVNPEITKWKGMIKGREGCLSVPDYIGSVIRAEKITLKAQDLDGKPLSFHMYGYEARIVQHEIDHLDGLLFLDRLVSRHHDLKRRE